MTTPRDELAAVLGEELAHEVVAHRARLRKPMTPYAAKLLAKKLALFASPQDAANLMIERGWQSIEPAWAPQLAQAFTAMTSVGTGGRVRIDTQDPLWDMVSGFQGKDGAKHVTEAQIAEARRRAN